MKTFTVQVSAKDFYNQQFKVLTNRQKTLKADIDSLVKNINRARRELADIEQNYCGCLPTKIDRVFLANDIPPENLAGMLNDGYRFGVGDNDIFDRQFELEPIIFKLNDIETEQETKDRVEKHEWRVKTYNHRILEACSQLTEMEQQLEKIESEIKGFWKDPIRKANLTNA